MNWSGNMPMKMLQARKRSDPNIKLYKALDDANEENPLDISHIKTSFPYFPKARQFAQAIYKINLPGYFYNQVSSSSDYNAGVVMSYKASNIDVYALGVWMYGYTWTGCAACSGGGFVYLADRVVNNWTGSYSVPANPRNAHISSNHDRINLFMSTGYASSYRAYGGYANQFFPIIPGDSGLDAPNAMTGLHIYVTRTTKDKDGKETKTTSELELNGRKINGQVTKDITQTINTNPDNAASGSPVTDESVGTFVYWRSSRGTSTAWEGDQKWYAPCECVADLNCNCMTKVRPVSVNFGYNMVEINPVAQIYGRDSFSYKESLLAVKQKDDGTFETKTVDVTDKSGKKTGTKTVFVTYTVTIDITPVMDIAMYLLYGDEGTYKFSDGSTLNPNYVNTWHSLLTPSVDSGYLTLKSDPAMTRATRVFDKCFAGASIDGFTSPFTKLVYRSLPEIHYGLLRWKAKKWGAVSASETDCGKAAYKYFGREKMTDLPPDAPQTVPDDFWYGTTQTTVDPSKE